MRAMSRLVLRFGGEEMAVQAMTTVVSTDGSSAESGHQTQSPQ